MFLVADDFLLVGGHFSAELTIESDIDVYDFFLFLGAFVRKTKRLPELRDLLPFVNNLKQFILFLKSKRSHLRLHIDK